MSTGEQLSDDAVVWVPPRLGQRLSSSLATSLASAGLLLGIGFVALVVLGGIALLLLLLTGHGFDGIEFGNPAAPDAQAPDGLPTRQPWPTWVLPAVVVPSMVIGVLGSVVGAARFGHGSVGDGITGIEARRADGSAPSRLRAVVRVGIPVLVVLVLLVRGVAPVVVLLAMLVLWAPALAPSRRSLADLLVGVHPLVAVEPKLGRRWSPASDAGEGSAPSR